MKKIIHITLFLFLFLSDIYAQRGLSTVSITISTSTPGVYFFFGVDKVNVYETPSIVPLMKGKSYTLYFSINGNISEPVIYKAGTYLHKALVYNNRTENIIVTIKPNIVDNFSLPVNSDISLEFSGIKDSVDEDLTYNVYKESNNKYIIVISGQWAFNVSSSGGKVSILNDNRYNSYDIIINSSLNGTGDLEFVRINIDNEEDSVAYGDMNIFVLEDIYIKTIKFNTVGKTTNIKMNSFLTYLGKNCKLENYCNTAAINNSNNTNYGEYKVLLKYSQQSSLLDINKINSFYEVNITNNTQSVTTVSSNSCLGNPFHLSNNGKLYFKDGENQFPSLELSSEYSVRFDNGEVMLLLLNKYSKSTLSYIIRILNYSKYKYYLDLEFNDFYEDVVRGFFTPMDLSYTSWYFGYNPAITTWQVLEGVIKFYNSTNTFMFSKKMYLYGPAEYNKVTREYSIKCSLNICDGYFSINNNLKNFENNKSYNMSIDVIPKIKLPNGSSVIFNGAELYKRNIYCISPSVEYKDYLISNDVGNKYFDLSSNQIREINTNNDNIYLKYFIHINNIDDEVYDVDDITITSNITENGKYELINKKYNGFFNNYQEYEVVFKYSNLKSNHDVNLCSSFPLADESTSTLKLNYKQYLPDDVVAIDQNINNYSINVSNESKNKDNDLVLLTNEEKQILDTDESLGINDFDLNSSKMFEIPIYPKGADIIEIKANGNEINKIFYITIDKLNKQIKMFNANGTDITYEKALYNSDDNKITLVLKYNDFFSELTGDFFPTNIFGKTISLNVKGLIFLTNNFCDSEVVPELACSYISSYTEISEIINKLNNNFQKIQSLFDDDRNQNEKAITVAQNQYTIKYLVSPPFPSRVIYTNLERNKQESIDYLELYIKPKLLRYYTGGEAYKILVVKGDDWDRNLIYQLLSENIKSSSVSPSNNNWIHYGNKYYISSWINNANDYNSPIHLGQKNYSEDNYFEYDSLGVTKVHFFTILRDATGQKTDINNMRHSVLTLNQYFEVIKKPSELFSKSSQETFHEKIRFTKDVFIPSGYSIEFAEGSSLSTTKHAVLNNNIKIIVEGQLKINNSGDNKKIYFGPSGLEEDKSIGNNGEWGGIYILDDATLDINGAIISGAYNGIILSNNGTKSSISNCEIKYNEVGIHLYNSYPTIDNNVIIGSNLLYGVKEDKMTDNASYSTWKTYQELLKTNSNNNYINYYDYERTLIK